MQMYRRFENIPLDHRRCCLLKKKKNVSISDYFRHDKYIFPSIITSPNKIFSTIYRARHMVTATIRYIEKEIPIYCWNSYYVPKHTTFPVFYTSRTRVAYKESADNFSSFVP